MAVEFKIGATSGALTALDELTTPVITPQWEYAKYGEVVKLQNGKSRGLGFSRIIWRFPGIETDMIDQLESFFSGDPIYIRSRKRDLTFGIFEVIPNVFDPRQDGDHVPNMPGLRSGYEIEFTILSEVF